MRLRSVLEPFLARVAFRGGLSSRFDRSSARAIVADALDDYETQQADRAREPSAGGRVMVRLAALTIGLHRALARAGVPAEEARQMTAQVTWSVYRKMARIPSVWSRVGSRSPRDRLERATDLFRRFPFSAPSYDMQDVDAGPNVVAFDVRRCPVAERFLAHELGELCVESWCNLDFPLAELWGSRLERRLTIAGGASHCDFRWHCDS